jgi:hypothetical protein
MPSFSTTLIALVLVTAGAEASAIVSVKDAFWQADFAWYDNGTTRTTVLPDGVTLACSGTATATALGCRDQASVTVVSKSGVWEATTVDRIGGLVLRNEGGAVPGGVFGFTARFASFYPAGPESGAFVDDGAVESADYFTVVEGAGGFDLHGCNMASGPGHSGPHACRPSDSAFQDSVFTLGPSADWSELTADWRIYIQVSAVGNAANGDPVPEPPSLALFLTVAGLTACRRKARLPFRQIRRLSWSTGPSRRHP